MSFPHLCQVGLLQTAEMNLVILCSWGLWGLLPSPPGGVPAKEDQAIGARCSEDSPGRPAVFVPGWLLSASSLRVRSSPKSLVEDTVGDGYPPRRFPGFLLPGFPVAEEAVSGLAFLGSFRPAIPNCPFQAVCPFVYANTSSFTSGANLVLLAFGVSH